MLDFFQKNTRSENVFEFRRQLAHIIFGVLILWGIHFDILTYEVLAVVIIILFFVLLLIKQGIKIPIFYQTLHFFEREKHLEKHPGRGLFFFVLGAFFCVLFFEKQICMAALSILLIGDSVTNIAGKHIGKVKNPLNEEKTIEGTIAGIIASFLVCILFFPIFPSFITSSIAMIVEIPKLYIGKIPIDDNLTIPLSAGFILYLFSL